MKTINPVQPAKNITLADLETNIDIFKDEVVKQFAGYMRSRVEMLEPEKLTPANLVDNLTKARSQENYPELQEKITAITQYWSFVTNYLADCYQAFQQLEEATIKEFQVKLEALQKLKNGIQTPLKQVMRYSILKIEFDKKAEKAVDIETLESLIVEITEQLKLFEEEEKELNIIKEKFNKLTQLLERLMNFKNKFNKNNVNQYLELVLESSNFNNGLKNLIDIENPEKTQTLLNKLSETRFGGACYTVEYRNLKNNFEKEISVALNSIDKLLAELCDGFVRQINVAIDEAEKLENNIAVIMSGYGYNLKKIQGTKALEVDKMLLPEANAQSANEVKYLAIPINHFEPNVVLDEVKTYLEELQEELKSKLLNLKLPQLKILEAEEDKKLQELKAKQQEEAFAPISQDSEIIVTNNNIDSYKTINAIMQPKKVDSEQSLLNNIDNKGEQQSTQIQVASLPPEQNPPPVPTHTFECAAPAFAAVKSDKNNIKRIPDDLIESIFLEVHKNIQSRDSNSSFLTKISNAFRHTLLRKAKSAVMKGFAYELLERSNHWSRKTLEHRLETYRITNFALEELLKEEGLVTLKRIAAFDNEAELSENNYNLLVDFIQPSWKQMATKLSTAEQPIEVGKAYLPGMRSGFDRTIDNCFDIIEQYYAPFNQETTQDVRAMLA